MSSFSELYSHPEKPLELHLKNVKELSWKFLEDIPIEKLPIKKEHIKKLAQIITLSHDIGKSTTFFQDYLLKGEKRGEKETRHSLLSSIIAYYITKNSFSRENIPEDVKIFFPVIAFLTVKRHHGNFSDITIELDLDEEEKNLLKKQIDSIDEEKFGKLIKNLEDPNFQEISKEKLYSILEEVSKDIKILRLSMKRLSKQKSLDYYFLNNLLFSLLIDSDKSEVTIGKPERNLQEIPYIIVDAFKKTIKIEKKPINNLREKAYNEALSKEIDLSQKIYSLNLPTGLGKTFISLAFALKLREKIKKKLNYTPRIIYSLPFLSIIEQNAEVIEKILKDYFGKIDTTILLKHHHLADIYYKIDEKELEPDDAKILIEGWNSEIIITTFVQLFQTLLSNRNSNLRKLHRIFGSIIILDEVQSIPMKYWLLLREIFIGLVEKFNCYIIFSTATQPLIFQKDEMFNLVKGEDYFVQLNRTILIPNLSEVLSLEEFVERINFEPDKSYMFILNTINSAKTFYELLREKTKEDIIFLSSHVTPKERLERIEKIRNKKSRIVISTQLVEAGVDIDLDIVYRDIAPLDSINQSAGRCNRNWEKDIGEVDIFILKDERRKYASYIYDKILLEVTTDLLKKEEKIEEIKFINFIQDYFLEINDRKSHDISKNLLNAVYTLRYSGWTETEDKEQVGIENFKLIEEDYPKIDVFIELDEYAEELWKKYCNLKEIKDIYERRTEFQKIKGDFYKYVISVPTKIENLPPIVNGFGYVSKDNLEDFYSKITGYQAKAEILLW
ncbi:MULTISPECIES: CRISPR-associated helicase/endonuclease Cas3 [Dictyoglomus]|jgi:CRISPR-associated endonuclease/helicase Cas3|uniref:CRISPR-associated helicase Cas3 n=1 Tax=Dictyoglomus turgidum (strain DSM 6724 / Z-1310) TaxID=515635 RepID=B8DZH6_DICTD|nr:MULTISPECIES: CRISPR-associated helicase/endonuclease Cas3 [Dictyoglomus]ACK41909.1 CRISPR-associated helicase Cas3 [Dictyoglomus turgidum DSM 6724]HBU31534.1 CRISPR-associated helicase/endonuclease Cas3 [Dictyoglomus sp.]